MRSRREFRVARVAAVLFVCLNLSACAARLVVRPERAVLAAPESSVTIEWSSQRLSALALDGEPVAPRGSVQLALAPDTCARSVQFEGRAPSSAMLTRTVSLARLPQMVDVKLVDAQSSRETLAQDVAPGSDGMRRLSVPLSESGFAALVVSVRCADGCEFARVTAAGETGSRNTVSAGNGVCVHQIGDPIRLDRLFSVELVGAFGVRAEPFRVEVLN